VFCFLLLASGLRGLILIWAFPDTAAFVWGKIFEVAQVAVDSNFSSNKQQGKKAAIFWSEH
jgi:hypothetical protein